MAKLGKKAAKSKKPYNRGSNCTCYCSPNVYNDYSSYWGTGW